MLRYFLPLLLALSMCAVAKDRAWQEAKLTKIEVRESDGGLMVLPTGTGGVAGVPMTRTELRYTVETAEKSFLLWRGNSKPINLTVRGKTKIAIQGDTAYLLDDDGKEFKLKIVRREMRDGGNN